jgi:hypothetical protein
LTLTRKEKSIAVTGRGRAFREAFARFFEEPTREGLRELLRENFGEANELDFKREWPESSKLAKHVLGLANFGAVVSSWASNRSKGAPSIPRACLL